MRTTNKIIIAAVSFILILSSCTQNKFDPAPDQIPPLDQRPAATTSIKNLKEEYVKTAGFFSADIIESPDKLIFNGIVTSTDKEGNIYKYIVVQEEEGDNKRAIRISIDASGISAYYPVGQRVSIVANNLYIGKYGESVQMGDHYENNAGRITPGNLSFLVAKEQIKRYGKLDRVVPDTMTIAEILNTPQEEISYKLVCIKNAFFTGHGADFNEPGENILPIDERIFAPGTNGINYPQSREIQDGTGSIFISTSEFARFAHQPLPEPTYKGDITAIVSWYNNRDASPVAGKIYYQLTLRTLNDLGTGFEGYLKEINYKK